MNRPAVYYTFHALLALAFVGSGLADVLGAEEIVKNITAMGYPMYFITWLGVMKLAGVAAILVPGVPKILKDWAYGGFYLVMLSAIVSHLASGQGFGSTIANWILLGVITGAFQSYRARG